MGSEELEILKQRIKVLENENKLLKEGVSSFLTVGDTISVPEHFKPIFDIAQKTVGKYFQELKADPSKASIEIHGERYVLLRASSLSVDFLTKIKDLYADKGEKEAFLIGKKFLFDVAHVLGIGDATNFHKKMDLKDPIAKLSAGPVHFAYSGWAFVEILPESNPAPNDTFLLKYNHPYSFEADSWIKQKKKSDSPVCIMNAGYSSGWCEESFGIPLTAVEITCRAKGDDNCTFIMAPPHKIEEHLKKENLERDQNIQHEIPLFFERKKAEEKIKSSLKEKETLLKEVHHRVKNNLQIVSSLLNLQSKFLPDSETVEMFNETKNRVKTLALVHEKLYEERAEFVDIKEYIKSIIDLLDYSFDGEGKNVKIKWECDYTKELHIDRAIPAGLIVNELISNVFKYAFPEDKGGNILVKLTELGGEFKLTIKDDGIGIPENFVPEKSDSLGLEIILLLSDQLGGDISFKRDAGTEVSMSF